MHDFQVLAIVVEVVAASAQLKTTKLLYSGNRAPALVKLRDTALFLIRAKTTLSLPEIGRFFKRDHSSIHTAIEREGLRLKRNPPRADKLSWAEYHARLQSEIDKAVAAVVAPSLPN
jgi:hypothetical protein